MGAAAAPFHEKPVETQRVRHAVVDEVDLLDRYFERSLAARAVELVLAHLALLPAAERKFHLAAAPELRIARVEDAAEAGAVLTQGEELELVAVPALVDLDAVPGRRPVDALVSPLPELERCGRHADLLRSVPRRAGPELDGNEARARYRIVGALPHRPVLRSGRPGEREAEGDQQDRPFFQRSAPFSRGVKDQLEVAHKFLIGRLVAKKDAARSWLHAQDLSNGHVEQPQRANASRRSARTCCSAARQHRGLFT